MAIGKRNRVFEGGILEMGSEWTNQTSPAGGTDQWLWPLTPSLLSRGEKMRDSRGSRLGSLHLQTSYNEHSTPHIMYKSCLVSSTLFLFCCILMADASFCNYWTVLIIKIKCIQTKKKTLKKTMDCHSNGLFHVFNVLTVWQSESQERWVWWDKLDR